MKKLPVYTKMLSLRKKVEDKAYDDAIRNYSGDIILKKIDEAYNFHANKNI